MKRYRKQDSALINNKPNWFISNILLHILMRNTILFVLRFPVEGDIAQVFTQTVDVKTLTFPMATGMYPMETKHAKSLLGI